MPRWLLAVAVLLIVAGVGAFVLLRDRGSTQAGVVAASRDRPITAASERSSIRAAADAGLAPQVLLPLPVLTGLVRDSIGGIAQAEVRIVLRGGTEEGERCQASASTHTVAGGGFKLGPLCPGQYDLAAERSGQVTSAVVRLKRGSELTVTLELGAAIELRVKVESEAHQPIAGAKVGLQDEATGFEQAGVTDATGTAHFSGASLRPHSVTASATGYLSKSLSRHAMAAGLNEVKLTLTTGLMLEGRVIDATGAGVVVPVTLALPRVSKTSHPDVMASAASIDGGLFTVGPVVRGNYLAVVDDEPWERIEQPVKLPSGPIILKVSKGATVEGEFLDEEGAPVHHAELWFMLEGGGSRSTKLEPEAEGVFRLEGVRSGQHSVVAAASSEDGGIGGITATMFTVRSPATAHVTLRVERGKTISGSCTVARPREEGIPAVFAAEESLFRRMELNGHPDSLGSGAISAAACTPTFELKGLRPGRYALICDGQDEPIAWARAGESKVVVVCPGDKLRPKLRFHVADPQGRPVTEFGLSEGRIGPHPRGDYQSSLYDVSPYVLKVFAIGFATFERLVKPEKDRDLDLGTLVLTPARTLTGRVIEKETHQPVEGAEVSYAVAAESAERLMRTGVDGTFTLSGVPTEDSELHVTHPAFLALSAPLKATQTNFELELSAAGRVLGTVVTRDGRPTKSTLTARATGPETFRIAPVENSAFELRSLPNGTYRVQLEGGDAVGFSPQTLEVTQPQTYRINFVERLGGASFIVELVDEGQRPVDAVGWLVQGAQPRPATQAAVKALIETGALEGGHNADGALVFSSVPSGTWTLIAQPEHEAKYLYLQALTVSESMASVVHATLPMTVLAP